MVAAMSLRTIFKTAAYCSPTIAGLSATFLASGANLPLAAFMGGTALFSGLFFKRFPLMFYEPPADFVEAPQRLQNIYYKFTQKTGRKATSFMMMGKDPYFSAFHYDPAENAHAYTSIGMIAIGQKLKDSLKEDEIEFLIGHEMHHLEHPDKETLHHVDKMSHVMTVNAAVSLLACILPPSVDWPMVITGAVLTGGSQWLLAKKMNRMVEAACDRESVKMTGNPEAAIRALWYIKRDESATPEIFSTHPKKQTRIDAIADAHAVSRGRVMELTYFNGDMKPALGAMQAMVQHLSPALT